MNWKNTFLLLFTLLAARYGFSAITIQISAKQTNQSTAPTTLPGTEPLIFEGNVSARLLNEAHSFVDKKIQESATRRMQFWKRNLTSRQSYENSVEPNRKRLRKSLGIEERGVANVNYNLGLPDKKPAFRWSGSRMTGIRFSSRRHQSIGFTR